MNILLQEMSKLHHQITVTAAILMGIRGRIEFKLGIPNRIGSVFKDGNRGVLIVGKAGTAKTRCMEQIYNGLQLEKLNREGKQVGKWFSSCGSSTAIGIYETFELYSDSIIFLDEFNLDTRANLDIIKQICNGEISRIKHGSIEPIEFTGRLNLTKDRTSQNRQKKKGKTLLIEED